MMDKKILARARDFYAIYMASCEGRAWDNRPCPKWDKIGDAVQRHWYTVALRSIQLQQMEASRLCEDGEHVFLGQEKTILPNSDVIGHLGDDTRLERAVETWTEYSR